MGTPNFQWGLPKVFHSSREGVKDVGTFQWGLPKVFHGSREGVKDVETQLSHPLARAETDRRTAHSLTGDII